MSFALIIVNRVLSSSKTATPVIRCSAIILKASIAGAFKSIDMTVLIPNDSSCIVFFPKSPSWSKCLER